ncbi:MAG: NAD(P)H-binding protein [Acidimicrobiia bacterium]|nr:NAD(P)H-binding protein [Acidimicrobiia bacterium]MBT8217880.1 NAD(P)H-binding protein [Acidimicrobiia bacterium]NNF09221.1 NAD(P)H-binding protein [Acidimicrobiia bacterium]NNL71125.1 NAD(P)H-binding protein [Acidimicrobiia bacterium]
MPAIVIGADTEHGAAIARALTSRQGEVRAFITDPTSADALRQVGIKVAIGDVSDASHIEGAAHEAFTGVAIAEAADDDRERSFAKSAAEVAEGWLGALRAAGVRRVIWVGSAEPAGVSTWPAEFALIDPTTAPVGEVADEVVRLDDLGTLDPNRD